MIAKLMQLLQLDCHTLSPAEKAHQLNLATVSLLIEVINADDHISPDEITHLLDVLQTRFNLSAEQAKALFEQGQQAHHNATSLFEFTEQINAHFNLEQKQTLVLSMWELSFIDDTLCQYEDQIIRRVADLLHLKHSELIQLRNQANPDIPG
ncbi:TerB family tellurite resistance protein [Shewanella sp. SR44-3]|uniref:tellurite resistance TerB family protein n=1 Tax=Shewanella sp. SR44-3 TaxID=2760936 RepID=UPI0015FA85F7|nr:TerB family tellurite resistance protein [Shewanella sp. SR44-3]MBB1268532.1 TerB family tellurite resistance protein [Shewanella sp. SR44-3]